jgi:two-component system, OmpR family, response regulator
MLAAAYPNLVQEGFLPVRGTEHPVVLVVEDEWLVRDMVTSCLREAGWHVLEAATGEGALALLQSGEQVDVLVTDINLGGSLNGWDIGEAFRTANPAMSIIYASGNSVEPRRRVPDSLFFNKPYDPEAVLLACDKLK